jgi:hypothetical protein
MSSNPQASSPPILAFTSIKDLVEAIDRVEGDSLTLTGNSLTVCVMIVLNAYT